MIEVQLLGVTQVRTATRVLTGRDFGGVKPRQVLEVLALQVGHPVSKDRLADLLWNGTPPASFLTTLEGYVSLLRHQIQPDVPARSSAIRTVSGGYLLDATEVQVDSRFVRDLVVTARSARPAAALALLRQALSLGAGELLGSASTAAWAEIPRHSHDRLMVEAGTKAAEHALQLGQHDLAVELADSVLVRDPLAEDACRCAMRGLWASGCSSEALRRYSDLRSALAEELGVDPAPATQTLMGQLLRDEAPPLVPFSRRSSDPAGAEAGASTRQLDRLVDAVVVALRRSATVQVHGDEDEPLVALLQGVLDLLQGEAEATVIDLTSRMPWSSLDVATLAPASSTRPA